jgi:hypothetical protein
VTSLPQTSIELKSEIPFRLTKPPMSKDSHTEQGIYQEKP